MRNGSGRMAGSLDEPWYITGLGSKPGETALQEKMSSVWDTDFQVPWGSVAEPSVGVWSLLCGLACGCR